MGLSVLQIEIRRFVELIKNYKMHYLSSNLELVKMSKVAVWLKSTLKPGKPHKLNVHISSKYRHISLKSPLITLKIQSQRVLAARSTGSLRISKYSHYI